MVVGCCFPGVGLVYCGDVWAVVGCCFPGVGSVYYGDV